MVVSKWLTVVVFQNPRITEIDSFWILTLGQRRRRRHNGRFTVYMFRKYCVFSLIFYRCKFPSSIRVWNNSFFRLVCTHTHLGIK